MDNIKTDAQIADILKKLKDAKQKDDLAVKEDKDESEVPSSDNQEQEDIVAKDEVVAEFEFNNEDILPWFTASDRDTNHIHYIKFDDAGNLAYGNIKATTSTSAIAALKLTKDYACDVDYFKNKHFILYIKQLDSDYASSRSFVADCNNIEVEETKIVDDNSVTESYSSEELVKTSTEDITREVANCDTYYHYVVFTDLGIADFIARQSDVSYPYGDIDYNKWFEETSNYVPIINARYDSNSNYCSRDKMSNVNSYKYDIITMHRPGVITLDSADNSDASSQIHIKLKDEFSFLPLNRILKCLKYYALTENRSLNDFKAFICKYFDII